MEKKNNENKIKEIQELIYQKEQELKKKLKKKKKKKIELEINILQKQLGNLMMEEVNRNIRYMKQRYFEQADRPGKLLAWQIKKRRKKTVISELKINGENILDQEAIKSNFAKYYESLYKNTDVRKEDIEDYLQRIQFPDTSEKLREELNKEIEDDEILEAINSSSRGKMPGPDGFTSNCIRTTCGLVVCFCEYLEFFHLYFDGKYQYHRNLLSFLEVCLLTHITTFEIFYI